MRDYLKKIHKSISKKTIDKLGDKNGVTANEMLVYCKKYKVKMILYDVCGNIIASNYPVKKSKSYKRIIGILYNGHFYPIKNQYLAKVNTSAFGIKHIKNGLDKFIDIIKNEKFIPKAVKISIMDDLSASKLNIISFVHNGYKYIANPEYKICEEILKKFGCSDKIYDSINLKNIMNILQQLYFNKVNIKSFFPVHLNNVKSAYNFALPEYEEYMKNRKESDIITVDKNKCYSCALKQLPFLIKLDYRQSKITRQRMKFSQMVDHYMYIVKPDKSSVLLPETNMYSGRHLKYCMQYPGMAFEVLEEITCVKVENRFKCLIDDVYKKVDHKYAKTMCNVMIGKMEKRSEVSYSMKLSKICNEQESKTISAHKTKIDDDMYAILENVKHEEIMTLRPINIQVKDQSRRILFEKILELDYDKIIQIKTDSISFIGRKPKKLNTDPLNGWKYEKFSRILSTIQCDKDMSFTPIITKNNNTIYQAYAGCGKSFHVMNKIIPSLGDKYKNSYIILTPSHSTIEDYRKKGYKCDVIQKYQFGKSIPSENLIIIDEHGLMNRQAHNILYKCFINKKKIISLGDFSQLLPVCEDSTFDSIDYLNMMFGMRKNLSTNYRNNFSIKYYDQLINEDIDVKKEVFKHSVKYASRADIIIAYRNDVCVKYNDYMLKKLKFKDKFCKGVKLICKSNDLRRQNMYNNYVGKIEEIKKVGNDKLYKLDCCDQYFTHEQINTYFKLGYCLTIYGVQGKGYKSYYFCKEDQKFINGRSAYTIISRLIQN